MKRATRTGRSFRLSEDKQFLIVRIPMALKNGGARKLVVVPDGSVWRPPPPARTANALTTALARAHRWKAMMESGDYGSTTELAKAEGINFSYLCRVLRLTLLSPSITEAILNNAGKLDLELKDLMRPFPIEWDLQEDRLERQ